MSALSPLTWSRGSEWRRWDPHIHTPVTLLANEFAGDWEAFDRAVNAALPAVEAVGVTDYGTLRGYREFRRRWLQGAYPAVKLIFPNIELRITTQTKRGSGINIHLLFSSEDENHEALIDAALSRLIFKNDGGDYRLVDADLQFTQFSWSSMSAGACGSGWMQATFGRTGTGVTGTLPAGMVCP